MFIVAQTIISLGCALFCKPNDVKAAVVCTDKQVRRKPKAVSKEAPEEKRETARINAFATKITLKPAQREALS